MGPDMLQLLVTLAAGVVGYFLARNFVSRRLRFVDAVHSPFAPVVAGFAAALLAWPAALLPFVTLTTTLVFGIGTGLGTASGSWAVRRNEGHRRLTP
jgi:CHASE2 domain-containing sensor protein